MSTNESLRPQFWVLRSETNTMVPLIAVDELPPTVSIRGVPRSLEAKDLAGMTCAGSADSRHRTYIINMPYEPAAMPQPPASHGLGLHESLFATPIFSTPPQTNPNIFPQAPKAYGISEQMPSHIKSPITGNPVPLTSFTTTTAATPTTTPNPFFFSAPSRIDRNPGPNPLPPWQDAASVPLKAAPGVKKYCSFWLRNGECDYAQQGCLYLHEMPLDREVLEGLGHRDIPKWYRERHGLGSLLVGVGVGAGLGPGPGIGGEKGERMERSWRAVREDGERDGSGGKGRKRRGEKIGGGWVGKSLSADRRMATGLWKEDWEKKGDGRFAPKSSDKIGAGVGAGATSASTGSSSGSSRTSPVAKGRGPASRASPNISNATSHGHYQSALAKKTDERCLAALEAARYVKDREMEELKRVMGREFLQPKRQAQVPVVTPETSSSDESAHLEEGDGDESEWIEGNAEAQAAAISQDLKGMRLAAKEKK